jgi:hypothetical protein
MGRLTQLIRDLFGVDCSETEALSRLLRSDPMASMPRKLGDSGGGLIRKMRSGPLAIRGAANGPDRLLQNPFFAKARMNVDEPDVIA